MSKKVRITFEVEPEIKEHLKTLAEMSDLSLSGWIRRCLRAASAAQLVMERAMQGMSPVEQYIPDAALGLPKTPPAFQVVLGPVPAPEHPSVEAIEEKSPPGPPPVRILLPESNPASHWLHHIEWGETLSDVAARYYGDASLYRRIARANDIAYLDLIYAGQPLVIPKPELSDGLLDAWKTATEWKTHTVQPGETLNTIAAHYYGNGDEYWRIALRNSILPPEYKITPGEALTIPEKVE